MIKFAVWMKRFRSQNSFLMRQAGMTTGLIISSQLSQPDAVPLQSPTYLVRNTLNEKLKEDLKSIVWLALVDGHGKGKTQLAISIYQEFEDPFRCWISLRNQGSITSKHFREQIFRWLIQLTEEPDLWFQYIYGRVPFSTIIGTIAELVKQKGLLIIDDLPRLMVSRICIRNSKL